MTKISSGNQVIVPSAFRKKFNFGAGDEVVVEDVKDGILIKKALTKREQVEEMVAEFDELNRDFKERLTPEQRKFMEMSAGWTVNQYHEYFDNLPETKAYIKEKYGVEVK